MTRTLIIIFFILSLCTALALPVQASVKVIIAEDLPVVYLVDTQRGQAEATCSYSSASEEQLNRKEVYIHDEVELEGVSYPVTSLRNGFYNLFAAQSELKRPASPQSVRLPRHLRSIGEKAFYRCEDLHEVFIPSEVEQMGSMAFLWASGLQRVFNASRRLELGDGLSIGGAQQALVYQVDTIGQTEDFRYYTRDQQRYIYDMPETSHLVIPEGYQPGRRVCYGWKSLQRVTLPADAQRIDKEAFCGCSNLEHVEGLEHVVAIDEAAFASCCRLQEADLSPRLRELGKRAFARCTSLKSVELSDSLHAVGMAAFLGCESLVSVRLPQQLKVLPVSLFHGCTSLTDIELPATLRIISNQCFEDCQSLTCIELPDSLQEIWFEAFEGCKSLTEVSISRQVKKLEWYCFQGCESLQRIHLNQNITKLGDGCLADCTSLRYLICDAVTPPLANNSCFKNILFHQCEVYIPTSSVDAYRQADGWQYFRLYNEKWDLSIDALSTAPTDDTPKFDVMGRRVNRGHRGLTIQKDGIWMIKEDGAVNK